MKANAAVQPFAAGRGYVLLLGLAAVAAVAALRAHSWTEPLEADEAIYMIVAGDWLAGGKPYVTAWDHKPLGTFVLYRWGIQAFGYSERAPRALAMLAMFASTVLLVAILRRQGWWRALLGVAVWLPLTCWVPAAANGGNMEIHLLPFILGAWLLLTEARRRSRPWPWRMAAVGVIVVSLLVKPMTLPYVLIPFAVNWPNGRRAWLARVGGLAAVVVAIVAAHVTVYWLSGYPPAELVALVRGWQRYTEGTGSNVIVRLLWTGLVWPWHPGVRLLLPVTVPVLAGIAWRLWRSDRSRAWEELLFLGAGLAAVAISGGHHAHYFIIVLPVLAVSLARSAGCLARRRRLATALAGVLVVYLGACTWFTYLRHVPEQLSINKFGWSWFPRDRYIGRQLAPYGVAGRRLFVSGSHPGIIFYSRATVPDRYFVEWTVAMGATTREEIMAKLRADPPPFVVMAEPETQYPGLPAWLAANYEAVAEIAGATLWRRQEVTEPAASR